MTLLFVRQLFQHALHNTIICTFYQRVHNNNRLISFVNILCGSQLVIRIHDRCVALYGFFDFYYFLSKLSEEKPIRQFEIERQKNGESNFIGLQLTRVNIQGNWWCIFLVEMLKYCCKFISSLIGRYFYVGVKVVMFVLKYLVDILCIIQLFGVSYESRGLSRT